MVPSAGKNGRVATTWTFQLNLVAVQYRVGLGVPIPPSERVDRRTHIA